MKKYIIVHRPDRDAFFVYKNGFLWFREFIHSFYYDPAKLSDMKFALNKAKDYISYLKEMDDAVN